MATTSVTRLSAGSPCRSTSPELSNARTRTVMADCDTPSMTARSVIRWGPVRSNVANVDPDVRLTLRGARLNASTTSS